MVLNLTQGFQTRIDFWTDIHERNRWAVGWRHFEHSWRCRLNFFGCWRNRFHLRVRELFRKTNLSKKAIRLKITWQNVWQACVWCLLNFGSNLRRNTSSLIWLHFFRSPFAKQTGFLFPGFSHLFKQFIDPLLRRNHNTFKQRRFQMLKAFFPGQFSLPQICWNKARVDRLLIQTGPSKFLWQRLWRPFKKFSSSFFLLTLEITFPSSFSLFINLGWRIIWCRSIRSWNRSMNILLTHLCLGFGQFGFELGNNFSGLFQVLWRFIIAWKLTHMVVSQLIERTIFVVQEEFLVPESSHILFQMFELVICSNAFVDVTVHLHMIQCVQLFRSRRWRLPWLFRRRRWRLPRLFRRRRRRLFCWFFQKGKQISLSFPFLRSLLWNPLRDPQRHLLWFWIFILQACLAVPDFQIFLHTVRHEVNILWYLSALLNNVLHNCKPFGSPKFRRLRRWKRFQAFLNRTQHFGREKLLGLVFEFLPLESLKFLEIPVLISGNILLGSTNLSLKLSVNYRLHLRKRSGIKRLSRRQPRWVIDSCLKGVLDYLWNIFTFISERKMSIKSILATRLVREFQNEFRALLNGVVVVNLVIKGTQLLGCVCDAIIALNNWLLYRRLDIQIFLR